MNLPTINFGAVKHRRFRPAINAFGYGVFTVSIPMRARRNDPTLLSQHGLKDKQFGLFSFFDQDHGLGNENSLSWIESILKENHVHHDDGEIWLHTLFRECSAMSLIRSAFGSAPELMGKFMRYSLK
jgi:DUF1365 family protein